jgi:hypothetical protein
MQIYLVFFWYFRTDRVLLFKGEEDMLTTMTGVIDWVLRVFGGAGV